MLCEASACTDGQFSSSVLLAQGWGLGSQTTHLLALTSCF